MKYETLIINFLVFMMIILSLFSLLFLVLILLDYFLSYDSYKLPIDSTEKVPCVDGDGNIFENRICIKQITCSRFGLIGDKRCPG